MSTHPRAHSYDNERPSTFAPKTNLVLDKFFNDAGTSPFVPGLKYKLVYHIVHKNTGRYVQRAHPTPFRIYPVLAIRDFDISLFMSHEPYFQAKIDNIRWSDEIYRGRTLTMLLTFNYWVSQTSTYGTRTTFTLSNNFDVNKYLSWRNVNSYYLGRYMSVRIRLVNLADNVQLIDKTTPRFYIPLSVPFTDYTTSQGTRLYP